MILKQFCLGFTAAVLTLTLTSTRDVSRAEAASVFDVTSYGARGNGTTDDTAAIQRALDAAAAVQGTVSVPAGTYRTGGLKVSSNVTIAGASRDTSILLAKDNILDHIISPKYPENMTVRNVKIRDLKLLGRSAAQNGGKPMPFQYKSIFGIAIIGGQGWRVERVWAEDFDGDGIYVGRGSPTASPLTADNNQIIDCVVRRNVRNGMMFSDGDNNLVSGCLFEQNQVGMDPSSPKYSPTMYESAELDIEPNGYTGVHANNNIIENSTFKNGYNKGVQFSRGGDVELTGNILRNNTFIDNTTGHISIHTERATGTIISGNTFTASSPEKVGMHLRLSMASNIRVENNTFQGGTSGRNTSQAVKVDAASSNFIPNGTVFRGNRFDLTNGVPPGTGILIGQDSTNTVWIDNTLLNARVDARGSMSTTAPGVTDTTPPVLSNVTASEIHASGATISWSTDEMANDQVEFWSNPAYIDVTETEKILSVSHSRLLTGLQANRTYNYRVRSRDYDGNLAISPWYTFAVGAQSDSTPPAISAVQVASITATSATLSWTTDEPASSGAEFGPASSYGTQAAPNPTLVTSHALSISGLQAGTTYNFRVWSKDANGNTGWSGNTTFTTSSVNTSPPVVSSVGVTSLSTVGATLVWTTDTASTSGAEYGPTSSYGTQATPNSSLVTGHALPISGLKAGTTYNFRVWSKDANGNTGWSGNKTFATLANPTDTTAPTVSSSSPVNGATTLTDSTRVTAIFSEPMNPATISGGTVKLVKQGGSAATSASVTYDQASRTVTLTPGVALAAGSTYTATVKGGSKGVKDLAGNALASDRVWSFTTKASTTSTVKTGYLSDQNPTFATNGLGLYERNMSNGNDKTGDGRTITLNGIKYAKGLGVAAASELRYDLGGRCTRFQANVGVDDEAQGTVSFQVWTDGTKRFDSQKMNAKSATKNVSVTITRARELRLVVTDSGDGTASDHGDWASARVTCS